MNPFDLLEIAKLLAQAGEQGAQTYSAVSTTAAQTECTNSCHGNGNLYRKTRHAA